MGTYDLFGFFFVAVLAVGVGLVVAQRREDWSRRLTLVFVSGLLLRLVGSTLRYEIFFRYYHGGGDAGVYYSQGLFYASLFRRLDFGVLFDPSHWYLGHWWGTQFVRFLSGFVLTFLGPTMRGEFLVFSLFAFLGLMCCLMAFRKAYPWVPAAHYARWILFWPSLWFWPSSVGKEAVVMLAIGLTVWGHVGNGQKTRWGPLAAGLGLAWAVRPHVAAVLIVSAMISHWFLRQKRGKGPVGLLRNVLVAVLALVVAVAALQRLGVDQVDVESVQEFMSHRAQLTATGGSEIMPSGGWLAIPMAFVNILMRPFPWEAHNAMALVSALEIVVLWFFVWRRRRTIWIALRRWNRNRLLSFALPFAVLYVLMIGLVFFNLGIIARQRVLVMPFLLLLLEARPLSAARLRALRRRRRARLRDTARAGRRSGSAAARPVPRPAAR